MTNEEFIKYNFDIDIQEGEDYKQVFRSEILYADTGQPWIEFHWSYGPDDSDIMEEKNMFHEAHKRGLIAHYRYNGMDHFYEPDHPDCQIMNIAFRIPGHDLFSLSPKVNLSGIDTQIPSQILEKVKKAYTKFLTNWVLGIHEDQVKKKEKKALAHLFYHYSRTEGIISIPKFLWNYFRNDLQHVKFNGQVKNLTIQWHYTTRPLSIMTCPSCENEVPGKSGEMITCRFCKTKFQEERT